MAEDFVLIVEAHDDLRDLLTMLLGRQGFAVAGVGTMEAAHFVFQQGMPSVVLLAIPHEGPVRCPLPTLQKPSAPPTVVISTRRVPDALLRREFGNYAGCIMKPVDPNELIHLVASIASPAPRTEAPFLGEDRDRRESGPIRKATLEDDTVEAELPTEQKHRSA